MFRRTTPSGLIIESELPISKKDVEAFLFEESNDAKKNLGEGPKLEPVQVTQTSRRGFRVGDVKIKREPTKSFYEREIPRYLGVPKKKFDYGGSLDKATRGKISFLQSVSAKAYYLAEKYGKENIEPINLAGEQTLMFRKSKTDKWKLIDSETFELADITSDLAGGAIPVGAGIISGLVAAGVSFVNPEPVSTIASPAIGVATGVATEFGVGVFQDRIARNALGIPEEIGEDFLETLGRRGKEAAFNAMIEIGTLGTGRAYRGLRYGKKSTDLAEKELQDVIVALNQGGLNIRIPRAVQEAGGVAKLAEVATAFPDSAAAKFQEEIRDAINQRVTDQFGLTNVSPQFIEEITRRSILNITDQMGADEKLLREALERLAKEKTIAQGSARTSAEALAKKEAKEAYEQGLNKIIKSSRVVGDDVLLEPSGKKLRDIIIRNEILTRARISNIYDQSYSLLSNVRASTPKIQSIFNRQKNKAILDQDENIVNVLAPQGITTAGNAARSLDDLVNDGISFQQLDSLIRDFNTKANIGAAERSQSQIAYGQMAKSLKSEQERILNLKDTPSEGRRLYNLATREFKTKVTPFRESSIFNIISPDAGESTELAFKIAKKSIARGEQLGDDFIRALPSSRLGTETLESALKSPTSINNFLRVAGNTTEARNILRNAWLRSKGISGSTINKDALKMGGKDESIIATLWKGEESILNAKIQAFRRIGTYTGSKDKFIDGLTEETTQRILSENNLPAIRKLEKIGIEEQTAKTKLKDLQSKRLSKLMARGDVPLPNSIASLETFADGILKSSNEDFVQIVNRFAEEGTESKDNLIKALFQDIMTKAKSKNPDLNQFGSGADELWNASLLQDQLIENKDKLVYLLGKDGYDNIYSLNRGFERASKRLTKGAEEAATPKPRVAMSSPTETKFFFGNLQEAVSIRLSKLILYGQLKSPVTIKKMLDEKSFEKVKARLYSSLLVTGKFPDMLREADADPQFRVWLDATYADITEEATKNKGIQVKQPDPKTDLELLKFMDQQQAVPAQ